MRFRCEYCGCEFEAKEREKSFGRTFCTKAHYDLWRKEHAFFDQQERRRDYSKFRRFLWGGSGKGRNEVGPWAREFGRRFEAIAEMTILPNEGFSEIDNWSNHSSAFFIDFVATKDGKRVLIDVTIKWAALVKEKAAFAHSLRMDLYILHISPADPTVYHLRKMPPGGSTSKVPMKLFHELYQRSGRTFPKAPVSGPRANRIEKLCGTCGRLMHVPERLRERKRFCSRKCASLSRLDVLPQFKNASPEERTSLTQKYLGVPSRKERQAAKTRA